MTGVWWSKMVGEGGWEEGRRGGRSGGGGRRANWLMCDRADAALVDDLERGEADLVNRKSDTVVIFGGCSPRTKTSLCPPKIIFLMSSSVRPPTSIPSMRRMHDPGRTPAFAAALFWRTPVMTWMPASKSRSINMP